MSAETLPTDRLIGEVLANRYEILHRLGEGAMGAVYKARHVKVGRPFAVKVLHTRVLEDPKVVQRFEREAELAGRLRHANVVGVVDVGEIDGMRYMVMDFAEGPDLAQLLDEAPMPPLRIIHLVRQLLEGLYHAHERGLIHRDFKPENVIVERDSHGAELPRIVDFGIAILRDGGAGMDQDRRLTTNGLVLGTPHYMAPEQAVADPIDHRIDLFALGIVVYEMLSGRLPYDGTGAEVARANLLLDPPPIAQRVPYLEVDPLLEAFARRLMAKKREARPPTAKAARELLDLIERDRTAAAAALGLPPALGQRSAAMTQPVEPQGAQGSLFAGTPGPPLVFSEAATTRQMRSPGVVGPVPSDVSIGPAIAYAPTATVDPRVPIEQRSIETSTRTPLDWQTASVPRRRMAWLAIAAAGATGVALALVLLRAADTTEPPLVDPPPSSPPASSAAPATTPPAAQPDSVTAPATPVVPDEASRVAAPASIPAAVATASEPRAVVSDDAAQRESRTSGASPPSKGATRALGARPSRAPASNAKPPSRDADATQRKEIASTQAIAPSASAPNGEKKPAEPAVAAAPKVGESKEAAKPADPRPSEKPADPKVAAPPRTVGLTANELSHFYQSVGRELAALPHDSAQELWGRLKLIKLLPLMSAPQAKRDEAAQQLLQIHQEAARRKP